jgi:hypothetical protein
VPRPPSGDQGHSSTCRPRDGVSVSIDPQVETRITAQLLACSIARSSLSLESSACPSPSTPKWRRPVSRAPGAGQWEAVGWRRPPTASRICVWDGGTREGVGVIGEGGLYRRGPWAVWRAGRRRRGAGGGRGGGAGGELVRGTGGRCARTTTPPTAAPRTRPPRPPPPPRLRPRPPLPPPPPRPALHPARPRRPARRRASRTWRDCAARAGEDAKGADEGRRTDRRWYTSAGRRGN